MPIVIIILIIIIIQVKKTGFEGGPNTSFIVVAVFDTGYCCSAATPGMMGSWFARLPMESHPEVNGVASRND